MEEGWVLEKGEQEMEVYFPHITNSLTVTKQRKRSPAKKIAAVIAVIIATGAGVIGIVA